MGDNDNMPPDPQPMSEMAVGAVATYEVFKNYLDAGFDAGAALYLTACLMCGGPKAPPTT